jgi:hypothetical protein
VLERLLMQLSHLSLDLFVLCCCRPAHAAVDVDQCCYLGRPALLPVPRLFCRCGRMQMQCMPTTWRWWSA